MNNEKEIDLTEDEIETNEMKGKYLTFWTDKQLFGVPISDVVQIIGNQAITPVPDFPSYAKGVINLRGDIIPVIDVRIRFGKEEAEYDEHTCVIVTKIEEKHFGFIVDSVNEVTSISDENISPAPRISKDATNSYLTGIGKINNKVVMLLDASKILSESEIELVNNSVSI